MARLILTLISFIFILQSVHGRLLNLTSPLHEQPLVSSNGVEGNGGITPPKSLSASTCNHMYGFFPCAENVGGYIFIIATYQYLQIGGEKLLNKGSTRMFNILGTGVFGASIFRVLTVLPNIVMMVVPGLFARREEAQGQVAVGMSINAGGTIFSLTLLWGICYFSQRKGNSQQSTQNAQQSTQIPTSESSVSEPLLGDGEAADDIDDQTEKNKKETSYMAGLMLLSLIPFLIMQLINVLSGLFAKRTLILVALLVSIASLVSYFIYQIVDPWIQQNSLRYSKYEKLLVGFLGHVQRLARGNLIDEDGNPNVDAIKRLFVDIDIDGDRTISRRELEILMFEIFDMSKEKVNIDYATTEAMKTFNLNNDGGINRAEFVEGMKNWLINAQKLASEDSQFSKELAKVIEPLTQKKKVKIVGIERIMAKILKHLQYQARILSRGSLVANDGSPNVGQIKRIFHRYDTDNNKLISEIELKQLIRTIRFGDKLQSNYDEVVSKVMQEFDRNGNNSIDEQEFVDGMVRWINEAIRLTNLKDKKAIDEYDKVMSGERSAVWAYLVSPFVRGTWAFNKSLFEIILGVAILTLCGGPLVGGILELSDALGIPFFFISFVIVPAFMNWRRTLAALFPTSQRTLNTSLLTFQQIYGGVLMSNLMGMSTLLAIVYAKDLTWSSSAEVLVVLMVGLIMGLLALFYTTYTLWMGFLAFLLYPFSLGLYFSFQYLWGA